MGKQGKEKRRGGHRADALGTKGGQEGVRERNGGENNRWRAKQKAKERETYRNAAKLSSFRKMLKKEYGAERLDEVREKLAGPVSVKSLTERGLVADEAKAQATDGGRADAAAAKGKAVRGKDEDARAGKKAKVNHLGKLYENVQAEKADRQAAIADSIREREERQAELDRKLEERRRRARKMGKRTGRGQPVLRYQMDAMLAKIRADM